MMGTFQMGAGTGRSDLGQFPVVQCRNRSVAWPVAVSVDAGAESECGLACGSFCGYRAGIGVWPGLWQFLWTRGRNRSVV